jgi:hypothetical protein
MNLREIQEELLRAATLVEDFEKNHLEIDRDAALNKMRQAYEALRFITPHTVIEEPAVEPLVPFTPDEESEPEVEVEFIMPEDDDEPTEEILPIAEPTEPATEEATEEEEQTEEEVVYVAEEDDDEAGYDVDCGLIADEERAHRACQGAHGHEDQGEACDEAQRALQGFAGAALTAAGKIGDIDGQHGQ